MHALNLQTLVSESIRNIPDTKYQYKLLAHLSRSPKWTLRKWCRSATDKIHYRVIDIVYRSGCHRQVRGKPEQTADEFILALILPTIFSSRFIERQG